MQETFNRLELPKVPVRRQEVKSNSTQIIESEVCQALERVKALKNELGEDHPLLSQMTESKLRESRGLRESIRDYKEYYFFTATAPVKKSLEK